MSDGMNDMGAVQGWIDEVTDAYVSGLRAENVRLRERVAMLEAGIVEASQSLPYGNPHEAACVLVALLDTPHSQEDARAREADIGADLPAWFVGRLGGPEPGTDEWRREREGRWLDPRDEQEG